MTLLDKYKNWLKLRSASLDEFNEKLCYCEHTKYCECGDPDINTFSDSLERGAIILDDTNNGWTSKNVHKCPCIYCQTYK